MLDNLLKTVRAEISALGFAITEGPVPDYATFLVLRGKLFTWKQMEEHLLLLREKEVYGDDADPT
jgi:hypothetical protein